MWVQNGCGLWLCLPDVWRVHWLRCAGSLCYFADVSNIGQDTARCSAFLSALSLCLWCVTLEYGSISRFKGVFRGFYGVCVGLCCLRALRGLCGFCARVELGGLKACSVFRLSFPLFSSLFLSFPLFSSLFLSCPLLSSLFLLSSCSPAWLPALPAFLLFVLLSWLCGLAFGVGWVVVSFSLADGFRHKKKWRKVFSLRPLFDL